MKRLIAMMVDDIDTAKGRGGRDAPLDSMAQPALRGLTRSPRRPTGCSPPRPRAAAGAVPYLKLWAR
jgi:hypothetical protein